MEKDSIEEQGIANVRRSFNWNSKLLKCMGIWPLKNYFPIFLFFFTYLFLHCSLTLAQFFWAPKTMENIISNIAENIEITMTLTKIAITRINRKALRKLFTEIEEYSVTEKYETKEEKLAFFNYTKFPPYFIIIIASTMTVVEILYYTSRLIEGIQIAKQNNSMGYQLPYETLQLIDLTDVKIYALICAYQILFVPCVVLAKQNNSMGYQLPYNVLQVIDLRDTRIYALICVYQLVYIPCIVLGYVGFDCMFVNLSIQVIAQFSILSYKVKTLLNNSKNYRDGMKRLVLRHYRLIRWSEKLEDSFNIPIMQQLLGTTIHICISGYYVLMGPDTKDILTLILFVLYLFSVTSTLFIYCLIGECFIQESTKFGNAIYNYEWYDLPAIEAKFFLICMARTKKPQALTSGKFTVLSLTVFTDIIKTSMGYLSVLRTFV